MADNPYVNRVVYGNQVLIDLTNDTVNASTLLAGVMAHGADGSIVTGELELSYHVTLHEAQYNQLTPEQKALANTWYYIDDVNNAGVAIADNVITDTKVWSSLKTNAELQAIIDMLADQYDEEETYNIGDICANGKQLYICNTDNTTGTWDSSKWTERNATDLIKQNTSDIDDLSEEVARVKSHIGMIVQSTTLDTMAKVIAIYGGTTWIQHTGYVLRGASSGVVANSAAKTGGNDNAIVPYHRHSVAAFTNASNGTCTATGGNHRHAVIFNAQGSGDYFSIGGAQKFGNTSPYAYGGYSGNLSLTVPNHAHTISAHNTNYEGTSGNTTNANIPNYKSVYIWERTA